MFDLVDKDTIAAFFYAYCSGAIPSKKNLTTHNCLIKEAKNTLELGVYAG